MPSVVRTIREQVPVVYRDGQRIPVVVGSLAMPIDPGLLGVTVEDSGVEQGQASRLNFTGAGVSATVTGGEATVTIDGVALIDFADAVPASGAHVAGEIVFNSDPEPGEPFAWRCVEAGTPGAWESLDALGPLSAGAIIGRNSGSAGAWQELSAGGGLQVSGSTLRIAIGAPTTVGGNFFTLTDPGAITFPRINADNSVSALSAAAFRAAIGAGTGGGDLVAANNLSDLASAATARTNLGLLRMVAFFFTTTPTASEVLCLYIASDDFTIPANMSGSQVSVGTNPTATFAIDVQKNGSTIGTISISTGGVATLTTTSGTAKSIAVGDVLKFVAPSSADATIANVAINVRGVL